MRGPSRRPLVAAALACGAVLAGTGAASGSFTQEPGSPWPVGAQPYSVHVADFNRDGRPDVAALNGTSSNVSVLLRRPTGGFATDTGSPYALGTGASGPSYGTVADMNADSAPDIVVPAYPSDTVSVLLRGGGTPAFVLDENPPHSAPRPSSAAAADFGGDGRVDLALPNFDAGTVTIAQRDLPVGFTNVGTVVVGSNPRHIAAADFNGDGDPDLAVTNSGSDSVSVLRGGAANSFTLEGAAIPVGDQPQLLIARDLNGDGLADIAVTNRLSNSVTLLLRRATGGFAPGGTIAVGTHPLGIAAGDFNSDGRVDLAVANSTDSTVSVLLRTSAGTYARDAGSPVATDRGASTVGVGDFDGDRRPDLAVSNLSGNTVTILLNTTPRPVAPPPPGPVDADRDGVSPPVDCNDSDAAIRPGVRDKPGDRIDQDCNGRDAPFPVIKRDVSAFSLTYPTYSRFTSMRVRPARRGDRLRLTCRGKGCEKRAISVRVRKNRRAFSLQPRIAGWRLKRGAKLELRVTRPATIGVVKRWAIRPPKPPKRTDRCVRPGTRKVSRCP